MSCLRLILLYSVLLVSQVFSKNSCRENEFRCQDGKCIDRQKECNGQVDCLDHSDEENCKERTCLKPEWFLCADNRTCLSHKFVCDGHESCPIGDDEKGCSTVIEKYPEDHCSKYEYTCADKTCIPLGLECDGKEDCPDKSDETEGCQQLERKCPGFLCKNKRCLTDSTWVCDEQDDCGDGSDEIGCMSHCTLDKNQFLCKEDISCISLDKVCDGKNDCKDESDEHHLCTNTTESCKKLKCPGKCHMLPTGPMCICKEGFKYNETSNTCDDINECNIYGICSHGCVNTMGSYYCTCSEHYKLKPNKKGCAAKDGEPLLLYTTQKTVVGVNLKTKHFYQIGQFLSQVVGVAYDGAYIYWTDINQNEESIERAKIDGSKREVLFTVGLEAPEDIAIDWYTGNIYFTDNKNQHLAVCSNHGYDCLILIQYGMDQPRGIALDPEQGKMYWTDWGKKAHIGKSSMDGTGIDKLVHTDIHWPNGLSLDSPNKRLYWVDGKLGKIQSIKLDGTDRRVILEKVPKHPYELAVFEDTLYWSDWGTESIHSVEKFTGKQHEVIIKDRRIYDIHIYHPALMQKGNNSCLGHYCSHMCLLNDKNSFTCACPEGLMLESDKRTCKDYGKKQRLFIGAGHFLMVMEHTVFGRHKMEDGIPLDIFVHKMTYNNVNGTLFVADNSQRAIFEVDWKKRNVAKLTSRGIENVSSISFDNLGQNLYWTDSNLQTIEVMSLRNRERAIIHRFTENSIPVAAIILPEVGRLFVALHSDSNTHIDIISLHGHGQHHHFAEDNIGNDIIQFAHDPHSQTVFWLDTDEDKIEFSDYDGSIRHLFRTYINQPVSMALLDEDIIWTTRGSRQIYWTHRSNLASLKKFSIEKLPYVNVPELIPIAASSAHDVVDHPCQHDNGGCSHVCLAASKNSISCLCPVGLVFKDLSNKTCIELLDCEFRCKSGECITSSRRCNGKKDCLDGSDEEGCGKQKNATCRLNEFACHDGEQCIFRDHRCDNHPDCNDKSDEAHCEHYDHTTKCHKMQFACENGRCIDPLMLCDDVDDCGDDSDEAAICKSEHHWEDVCGPDMFRCTSGQCIPKKWECDGHLDCKSGSDEHENCPSKLCPAKTFRCKQGICIDVTLKCDGNNDCGDYSDEADCEQKQESIIPCGNSTEHLDGDPTKFQCTSDRTKCLDISAKCNGTSECPRGEDEADCHGCRHDEFECTSSKLCIRKEFRCDRERDCEDGSDELHCDNYNATEFHSFAMSCREGMFDCKDGTCIDQLRVCDGTRDCSQGEDELSACATSCTNHHCDQKCTPSPYGAVCSCHPGYTLGGNKKMCIDVNECTERNPCAQLCENNLGSYRCGCYPDFMLWSDKIRCKSIERGHYLLFSSFTQLRKLSEHPSTLEIIFKSNISTVTGLDVNVKRNTAYFTLKDAGSLYEYNLDNGFVKVISDLGNPSKLAVDWITNNIYFIDNSMRHSINVCHFSDASACARLVEFERKDTVKTLAIDAVNKILFYSVMQYVTTTQPTTTIYRTELDGTRPKMLIKKEMHVSAMEPDSYKKMLYYTDLQSKTLRSVDYEGKEQKVLIKHERAIVYPSGLSIFENTAFIINTGSPEGLWCPLYGRKPCRAVALNVYNAEDVVVFAASRQKAEPNVCQDNKCSLICVQAQLGPKCLCEDGNFVLPGVKCKGSTSSGVGHRVANTLDGKEAWAEPPTNTSSGAILFVILALLASTVIGLLVYMMFRRKRATGKFSININFSNPLARPHNDGPGNGKQQSKISLPAMSFSKGKTTMSLDSKAETYKSAKNLAGGENSDCESMRDLENFDDNPRARLVL